RSRSCSIALPLFPFTPPSTTRIYTLSLHDALPIFRSGRYGEHDEWALENSCSGGGWREVPDLTSTGSREEIQRIVDEVYAQESEDRKSTRLNSSHVSTSYAVFCLKKKMSLARISLH